LPERALRIALLMLAAIAMAFGTTASAEENPSDTGVTTTVTEVPPAPPAADMPLDRFGELRTWLRERTNEIRSSRCQSRVHRFRHPHSSIKPWRRYENLAYWRGKRYAARELPSRCIRHERLWRCIHSREASWTDPGFPYWGGLQMGEWFMSHYAHRLLHRVGTADRWPPRTQMRVAERAYRSTGYSRAWLYGQWPNTAPPCASHA
jgi:hypothetical protein